MAQAPRLTSLLRSRALGKSDKPVSAPPPPVQPKSTLVLETDKLSDKVVIFKSSHPVFNTIMKGRVPIRFNNGFFQTEDPAIIQYLEENFVKRKVYNVTITRITKEEFSTALSLPIGGIVQPVVEELPKQDDPSPTE